MPECPEDANTSNCGRLAAQRLVDDELVVIDTYGMHTPGKSQLILDRRGMNALDVLSVGRVYEDGLADVVDLGCIACGQRLQMIDDLGELSVAILDQPS